MALFVDQGDSRGGPRLEGLSFWATRRQSHRQWPPVTRGTMVGVYFEVTPLG